MSFMDLVRARRSCRGYLPRPVPREAIDRCIEAARLAPSACNSQPWSFLVVDAPETIAEVARRAFSGLYRMNAFAGSAAALVVVVTGGSGAAARWGGLLRRTRYALIDVGIACEHLVLQSAEEGLGSCWIGWFDERALKRVLGLPRRARVDIVISLGYPAPGSTRETERKTLEAARRYATGGGAGR